MLAHKAESGVGTLLELGAPHRVQARLTGRRDEAEHHFHKLGEARERP